MNQRKNPMIPALLGRRRARRGAEFVMERIEKRVLLSAVAATPSLADLFARPTFVAYHPRVDSGEKGVGSPDLTPFSTVAPTGTTPAQMRHAYGVDQINFNGPAGDGRGQTIAIVDAHDQPNAAADLDAFNQLFNLQRMNQPGGPTFTKVDQNGGTAYPAPDVQGGWGVEISLDIEWAHVIAPEANILLVEANSNSDADLLAAVDTARNTAGVSVVSMSWGGAETSGETALDSHFATPAGHISETFLAATGDSGQPGGWPAFSADVVAVGGTTLTVDASGNYVGEEGWSGSGGGVSTFEAQPAYQLGRIPQSSAFRTIPDISMDADPATGVPLYDTYDFTTATPWEQIGGTSLACPMAAAAVVIADQGHVLQSGVTLDGVANTLPGLYTMPARNNSGELNYHDITSGNNGFAAQVGYDLVTGIGSVGNAMALTLSGLSIPRLAFAQQPASSTAAGNSVSPPVTVDVLDVNGQLVSTDNSNVTISLLGGGTLNGTLTVPAMNGVATFSDLSVNLVGSYDLQATDGILGGALSNDFTIVPGLANKLVYLQQPTNTPVGAIISPAVRVAVEDIFGNVVTGDGSGVNLAVASGPGVLSGTLTRNASGGVAAFNDLSSATAGVYTITASDGGLAGVTSGTFKIVPPPAKVVSINRMSPPESVTSDSTVQFQVLFNEAVTGVNSGDFSLALNGVTASTPVVVTGSGASYTVTVSGISGSGSLGLNLVDNGSIRDAVGHSLQGGGPVAFSTQTAFATGTGPNSVAVADVNGDGVPDLIVANYPGNSVSVLLGNGDGTFRAGPAISVNKPQFVTVGDINGDGKPDLIVQSLGYGAVFLGNGNGTFQPARLFPANTNQLIVADINGDGKPDLVFAELYDVAVLLGNGNGTFQAPRTFGNGAYTESVAASDLNGDGKPDLTVTYRTTSFETVGVLLGNGDGTFQRQPGFQIPVKYTNSLTTSDVNGDGKPDLIYTYDGNNSVNVLLGNGNGTFQNAVSFATGTDPGSVTAADVNGDGKPDLIVANRGYLASPGRTVSVLLGNGNGAFQAQQTLAVGSYPQSIAASDVNGDGKPDLIVANYQSNSVSVLLGNGNDDFTGQLYTIIPSLDTITGTAGVDQITLALDADHTHIDWTLGAITDQMSINDPAGLTINGGGSNDVVTLDYTNGSPLPNILHLNGTFTINGLQGTNPLAGTTLEIGKSIVFISYSSSDPIAAILGYLHNGYNSGGWNGTPTTGTGVITSAAAQVNNGYMIGYADSADGTNINMTPNSIALKYTLGGDLNLAGTVNFFDFAKVVADYAKPAAWDGGAFTYGPTVSFADFAITVANYSKQAVTSSALAASSVKPTALAGSKMAGTDGSAELLPAIQATGSVNPLVHHSPPAKVSLRKRR